jgi:hypothetical protein
VLAALLCLPAAAHAGQVKAGVAVVDASWHVGASAGQYASDGSWIGTHGVDPGMHATRRNSSYGIQSRLQARALVVQGPDGKRYAMVKNDNYIPQDLLYRRVAHILEAGDTGITRDTLTMTVTHDHSSPYYTSPSWGVWAFQDVFDIRMYDYLAKRMAKAVEEAVADLRPVRVGAGVVKYDKTVRHSFGPTIADDGTPAGYPNSDVDNNLTVVRFDDVSNRKKPKPYAMLVNFGQHPEFLDGNDLISADYVGPFQRMVDRATGAHMVFTQSAVGTGEPERSSYHNVHERLEFTHKEYAQAERGARLMTDAVLRAWKEIETGGPSRVVPFQTDFPVKMVDRWFPGPLSHPAPTVSNCRTDAVAGGDPGVPVVGLPDCERVPAGSTSGVDPGVRTDDLERMGVPVPENYGGVSYTGLEEDLGVHLQAIRLGDILLTICSCEQWKDQSFNIRSRTDRVQGNIWKGYDWGAQCTSRPDGKWDCPNPENTSGPKLVVGDHEYRRMRAQVLNNALGWNDPDNLLWAESEPFEPALVKGNYTHTELPPEQGYRLTVPLGMTNDYNGYIATYREYQRGDHYRKALTGWGPHSSDYMATRLVELGGQLNGGPGPASEPLDAKNRADLAHQDARVDALAQIADVVLKAYDVRLPDDGGEPGALREPKDVKRFGASFFTWVGGSNYTDNPDVRVERRVDTKWVEYNDQSGEIPVTLRYPQPEEMPAHESGSYRWQWTAHFEAFDSDVSDLGNRPAQTPAGTYRFVVNGLSRHGKKAKSYRVVSDSFDVEPWDGITVEDAKLDGSDRLGFGVGPTTTVSTDDGPYTFGPIDYPDTYDSPTAFIAHNRTFVRDPASPHDPSKFEWYCLECSFRPWADTGQVDCAQGTVVHADGRVERAAATEDGGRWTVPVRVEPGAVALVQPGGVRDGFDEANGKASKAVSNGTATAKALARAEDLAGARIDCSR